MDVSNIKPGGIEHRERSVEIARPDKGGARKSAAVHDSATISSDSRQTLEKVEGLAQTLKQSDAGRDAVVDGARARLANGDLNQHDVFRAVADRILRGDA